MLVLPLVAEWIHFTLFWDSSTHYKTEGVNFLGLMNSATKYPTAAKRILGFLGEGLGWGLPYGS